MSQVKRTTWGTAGPVWGLVRRSAEPNNSGQRKECLEWAGSDEKGLVSVSKVTSRTWISIKIQWETDYERHIIVRGYRMGTFFFLLYI